MIKRTILFLIQIFLSLTYLSSGAPLDYSDEVESETNLCIIPAFEEGAKFKRIHNFKQGDKNNRPELRFETHSAGSASHGVHDFTIDEYGRYWFWDLYSKKIIIFNQNFSLYKEYETGYIGEDRYFMSKAENGVSIYMPYLKKIVFFEIDIEENFIVNEFVIGDNRVKLAYNSLFVIGDLYIGEYSKGKGYFSFELIKLKSGKGYEIVYRNNDETFKFIKTRYANSKELWVHDNKYILNNERLVTGHPGTFNEYFKSSVSSEVLTAGKFIGTDKAGNYYWNTNSRVEVYHKNGRRVNIILNKKNSMSTNYHVTSNGNLYYVSSHEGKESLFALFR